MLHTRNPMIKHKAALLKLAVELESFLSPVKS